MSLPTAAADPASHGRRPGRLVMHQRSRHAPRDTALDIRDLAATDRTYIRTLDEIAALGFSPPRSFYAVDRPDGGDTSIYKRDRVNPVGASSYCERCGCRRALAGVASSLWRRLLYRRRAPRCVPRLQSQSCTVDRDVLCWRRWRQSVTTRLPTREARSRITPESSDLPLAGSRRRSSRSTKSLQE